MLPGDSLVVSIWRSGDGDDAVFRTAREDGTVVIDRGRVQLRQRAEGD